MSDDHGARELRLIRDRLDVIEHTQEVLVRLEHQAFWSELVSIFDKDPHLAQIFLLADGTRTQREIVAALKANQSFKGATEATVSRKLDKLRDELHLVRVIDSKNGHVHAHLPVVRILGLKRKVSRWIEDQQKHSA